VTLGKKGDVEAKRKALAYLNVKKEHDFYIWWRNS
jgi:hypothetical protein